ncbi:hypothetical protein [Nocardia caishijiensis]|uniref:hypothetical protein n=1 Tax=Nocardia caishijiensis TaxID=184756 RepID=UPI001428C1BB|nr:hypothetical protein [Nocardia caishijiensis]
MGDQVGWREVDELAVGTSRRRIDGDGFLFGSSPGVCSCGPIDRGREPVLYTGDGGVVRLGDSSGSRSITGPERSDVRRPIMLCDTEVEQECGALVVDHHSVVFDADPAVAELVHRDVVGERGGVGARDRQGAERMPGHNAEPFGPLDSTSRREYVGDRHPQRCRAQFAFRRDRVEVPGELLLRYCAGGGQEFRFLLDAIAVG